MTPLRLLLVLLSPALLQGPLRAAEAGPKTAYYDTGNPSDPAYLKGFDLRRDVFYEAVKLKDLGLKVLVAWDIDLTLGTPLNPAGRVSVGSDPWWNEQSDLLTKAFTGAYGPRKSAEGELLWTPEVQARYDARFGQLVQLNSRLHEKIALRPVEKFVPTAIKKAQAAGVAMLAVTARGPEMEQATLQDLKEDIGVDFSRSAPGGPGFSLDSFKLTEKARPAAYRNGVLQTSGQNKGDYLLHIFAATGYKPDAVFFVDDAARNTKDVFTALKNAGIPVRVFRYGHEDPRVEAYRAGAQPCVAQAQLEAFRRTGALPPDAKIRGARCDAERNFYLIYNSTAPAAGD
ncbi:MAG: DUF2608 domain-containing protein [Elusimicrobiales bacterium]|nr:DUF2608 domain-containing protein [Elusimicrobiales bacterium]